MVDININKICNFLDKLTQLDELISSLHLVVRVPQHRYMKEMYLQKTPENVHICVKMIFPKLILLKNIERSNLITDFTWHEAHLCQQKCSIFK